MTGVILCAAAPPAASASVRARDDGANGCFTSVYDATALGSVVPSMHDAVCAWASERERERERSVGDIS